MIREIIKRILREETISIENNSSEIVNRIVSSSLSNDEKNTIKSNGEKIFSELKSMGVDELNELFKEKGLFYGSPDKDFLEKNINDINFALNNIYLSSNVMDTLKKKKYLMILQLDSINKFERGETERIGRYIEFFHEMSNKDGDKMTWSIVNMFNNNYKLWVELINKFLDDINLNRKINSIPILIDYYFNLADSKGNKRALKDLIDAMINRGYYQKTIFNKTWGGGQMVEQRFVSKLKSIGFSDDKIYVFSGEKNAVDGVGIDLAVKCENTWIPIQVKSNSNDASYSIPYKGFSCFPYGNTYKLISKLNGNNEQRNITELCDPINKPISNEITDER